MNGTPPRIILTGQRFGRLLVGENWQRRGKSNQVYWECFCDCGGSKMVAHSNLTMKNGKGTASCGCALKEHWASLRGKPSMNKGSVIRELKLQVDPYLKQRYSLVTRGEWYGIFDTEFCTVQLVSRDKRDAETELARMITKPHLFTREKSAADEIDALLDKAEKAA